jgi:TetR/AcrR family transcriptional repressor of nem operon
MSQTPTRERLIEIGLRQIRSTGYAATGVKEILDLAKVPKGSFYHYFPSKEAFTGEVLTRYATEEQHRWEAFLNDERFTPLKRLRRYFEDLVTVYEQPVSVGGCLLGNLSQEVAEHSVPLRAQLSEYFGYWHSAIATVLREAVEAGELRASQNPDRLANFLIDSWEGALVRMKAENNSKPLHNFLNIAFNELLHP